MNVDHVVLWVSDPARSLSFYVEVLGMEPVRQQQFEDGTVSFPSVRLNDLTILDLMSTAMLSGVRDFTGGQEGGGAPINHLCLALNASGYEAVRNRLAERGIELTSGGERSFGAQGEASRSEYFSDPDGNVVEIRYYG